MKIFRSPILNFLLGIWVGVFLALTPFLIEYVFLAIGWFVLLVIFALI